MRERRYKKRRRAHRMFLVICEGETEEAYINLLRNHYRLPITIKTKVLGNRVTSRLVKQYVKELGVSEEDCQVVYVYDGDVPEITERIRQLEGKTVISTPCIELWFALHARECRHPYSSEEIVKFLVGSNPVWDSYVKGILSKEQSRLLLDYKESAIKRAQTLLWPHNPSSNMHEFLELLEREKNMR